MRSRRYFLQGAAVAAVAAVVAAFSGPVRAAAAAQAPQAPQARGQAPGYFRLTVGDAAVTALYDGSGAIPLDILHGASSEAIEDALRQAFIDPAAGAPTSINAFLVDAGQGLVLIDAGVGGYVGSRAGLLPQNLAAAGYAPDQVDTVLLTHMHSDHAIGLADGAGQALFPRAVVRVHEDEAAYWLGEGAAQRVLERQRKSLPAIQAAVAPYRESGRFATFGQGQSPAPGIEAVALPGHTPGHCGYLVAAKGEAVLFWGDIVHTQAVQFPHPEVTIDFDVDQPRAATTRAAVMGRAARERLHVAGAHLPFPGIGRLRAEGSGYVWSPARYAAGSA